MYFAIEGVIGVGKTTLARLLQPSFKAELVLEVFEENPFLSNFYSDRARYAFQTQIFFLLSRYHQQRRNINERLEKAQAVISDYTFEKDALFARINLAGDELDMYYNVQEALAEKVTPPNLVVYLRATTETLMRRIAQRDRPYERSMERDYIDLLNQSYDDYYQDSSHNSQVLIIESDGFDFVGRTEDLELIKSQIHDALQTAPFQPLLPIA
ncbi:MAG: putative deoxynucleoside kinase [Chloroflexi bacterium]|nr:MAG: putative deoxynucleoside kinase [Chloroflexota bacterium]MBA4374901.1 deoxynucleoside kinase [Anaerolinea sp.]